MIPPSLDDKLDAVALVRSYLHADPTAMRTIVSVNAEGAMLAVLDLAAELVYVHKGEHTDDYLDSIAAVYRARMEGADQ